MIKPIDIEGALAETLDGVFAPPLPERFDANLPCALVTRLGGSNVDLVIDTHRVYIDVYGEDWEQATNAAGEYLGRVRELAGEVVGGVQWGRVDVLSLPYVNVDPNHPDTPRVTFGVNIICKSMIGE